ncbi:MAG: hypothetical protein AUH43_05605 [Acidobacteria bacterium 13_1_40CM_65_14]|nr:MAG: hypothetical protein AUH43_05605 [Acidobacteria bacterium 13_1_40CM_65_14]
MMMRTTRAQVFVHVQVRQANGHGVATLGTIPDARIVIECEHLRPNSSTKVFVARSRRTRDHRAECDGSVARV